MIHSHKNEQSIGQFNKQDRNSKSSTLERLKSSSSSQSCQTFPPVVMQRPLRSAVHRQTDRQTDRQTNQLTTKTLSRMRAEG